MHVIGFGKPFAVRSAVILYASLSYEPEAGLIFRTLSAVLPGFLAQNNKLSLLKIILSAS